MANNTIRRSWNMYSMVNIEDLRGSAFQAEDGGHTFEITGLDANGNATALSGTVAAVFLRPDNTDVAIAGSVSNGKAYITLTDECYGYPGRFGLTIFLTSGGQKVAIYAAIGNVHRTSSGAVSPETAESVVDLINEIEAAIAQIPSSYTDIMAATAPTYSNTAIYAVGSYAWYDGKLYKCTTAITSGETWTPAHWTLANLGSDVSDLKSALRDDLDIIGEMASNGYANISVTISPEYAISKTTGQLVSLPGYTSWGASDYILIANGTNILETNADMNASSVYGFAVYDANKAYISGGNSFDSFDIPSNAIYIRITNYNANSDHSAIYLVEKKLTKYRQSVAITAERAVNKNNGSVASLTGYPTWGASDYIEIKEGCARISSNANLGVSTDFGFAVYDENKQYISGGNQFDFFDVPVNAKYLRLTDYNANGTHSGIYVNEYINSNMVSYYGIYFGTNTPLENVIENASILIGTFTLQSEVHLNENQKLIGSGCVVACNDSAKITMSDGSCIEGIKFIGSWNPTRTHGDGSTYTQYGYIPIISTSDLINSNTDALYGQGKTANDALIYIPKDNSYNTMINGCIFEGFDKLVIYAGGRRHTEKDNTIVCNNYFADCRMGIVIDGEFMRINSNEYLRCIVGVEILAGNSNQTGEIYKCCDVGVYMPSSTVTANSAHNEITSVEYAHCGIAGLYIVYLDVNLGCQLNGCHFADAPIIGINVNCLLIIGCRLDTYFDYSSGSKNSIICSNIRKGYLYGHELFSVPSDTQIKMNRGMGTVPDSDVNMD